MADRKSEATTLRRAVVLVTGGSGFVGSAIVRALNEKHPEWHICILDKGKDPRAEKAHRQQPVGDGLDLLRGCTYDYVQADITNAMEVMEAMARTKPDAVVHTAGVVPPLTERYVIRLHFSMASPFHIPLAIKASHRPFVECEWGIFFQAGFTARVTSESHGEESTTRQKMRCRSGADPPSQHFWCSFPVLVRCIFLFWIVH